MVEPHRRRQDVPHGAVDHLARRPARLRGILHQPFRELLLELAVPRAIGGQSRVPLDENLGDVLRELAHHVGGHPEAVRHVVRSNGRGGRAVSVQEVRRRSRPRPSARASSRCRSARNSPERAGDLRRHAGRVSFWHVGRETLHDCRGEEQRELRNRATGTMPTRTGQLGPVLPDRRSGGDGAPGGVAGPSPGDRRGAGHGHAGGERRPRRRRGDSDPGDRCVRADRRRRLRDQERPGRLLPGDRAARPTRRGQPGGHRHPRRNRHRRLHAPACRQCARR